MNNSTNGVSLWKTVAFVFSILAILGIIGTLAPAGPVDFLGLNIRFPQTSSLIADSALRQRINVEDQLAAVDATMNLSAADSAALSEQAARADSIRRVEHVFKMSEGSLRFPGGDFSYLFPTFRAMRNADREEVAVIHYGDSQIEGDRITYLIRDSLQALFGGSGPGVIPLWQPIPTRSVSQTLTDSVATFYAAGIMGRRASHDRYGAIAQMAELRGKSVTLTAKSRANRAQWQRVTAFVGNVEDTLTIAVNSDTLASGPMTGLKALNFHVAPCNELQISLAGRADIYGISISEGRGVNVTNVPLRGADALFTSRTDNNLIRQMLRQMNTRLVIMEFGGNALPMLDDSTDVDRYARRIGEQLDRMKSLCPEARIIFIGPADMAIKVDGELQTHPMLPYLTATLAKTADQHGVAFWDMYDVMGGRNSMLAWAEHQPPLAGTDYVHFTTRGAAKIAAVLWRAIKMNYDYMLLRDRQQQPDISAPTQQQ